MPVPAASRIVAILAEVKDQYGQENSAESLARAFEDPLIRDHAPGPVGRLYEILNATESAPGVHFRISFGGRSTGFKLAFIDPWISSSQQVNHFLTAVHLSLDPRVVYRMTGVRTATIGMDAEEVALKLVIGHELWPDPVGSWSNEKLTSALQFSRADQNDIAAFQKALDLLGGPWIYDLGAAEPELEPITEKINRKGGEGNSVQDLRLSLFGWRFARHVYNNFFPTRDHLGIWVTDNLKEIIGDFFVGDERVA